MGTCNSKSSAESSAAARSAQSSLPNSPSVEELVANSAHGAPTTRERLTWWREGMQVTEVYEIMEIVGQGSMGEVAVCRKKLDSSEKVDARTENLVALSEREDDETIKIAAEISATLNAEFHSKPKPHKRRRYACKTLNTMWMKNSDIMEYLNEVNILRDLDHPNIIQLFEVFSVKRKIWLIMELCTGGDLTARSSDMTEADVVIILEQILLAIKYMHKRNVCHRDIKLENILFADDTPSAPIKLIDFGLSNKFTKGQKMLQACGTVYTAAPEMLSGEGCTEQTDVWSIGVIAFIQLSGEYPFLRGSHDMEDEGKKEKLANAQYRFGPEWNERNISTAARDFVAQCFQKCPVDRWSAAEALDFVQHMWIPHLESLEQWDEEPEPVKAPPAKEVKFDETPTKIPPSPKSKRETLTRSVGSKRSVRRIDSTIIEGMQRYAEYSELKKTILMTMAYTMDKSSLHELRDIFVVLDTQGSGTVTLVDLKKALLQVHSERLMDDETIEKLFHGIDGKPIDFLSVKLQTRQATTVCAHSIADVLLYIRGLTGDVSIFLIFEYVIFLTDDVLQSIVAGRFIGTSF
mmetsp:Transcript_24292/g.50120  ORF Transcript_24292/g.50120 Transcript_24292/m.50120 type:complete len:577 (-) Transcript_24292:498-2228(-)